MEGDRSHLWRNVSRTDSFEGSVALRCNLFDYLSGKYVCFCERASARQVGRMVGRQSDCETEQDLIASASLCFAAATHSSVDGMNLPTLGFTYEHGCAYSHSASLDLS